MTGPGATQRPNRYSRKRGIFLILAIFFLAGGIASWILAIEHVLPSPWAEIIAALFAVLAVATPIFQWILPISHYAQKKNMGSLVIYTEEILRGKSVNLYKDFFSPLALALSPQIEYASSVSKRMISGRFEFVAIFEFLEPGRYTVYICEGSFSYHALITIQPGQIAEVDWRSC